MVSYWEYSALFDTQVTVNYNTKVINMDTGEMLPCAADNPVVVTKGTKLKFEFVPHEYTDISWFSAGASFDSPYGDWLANAARPYGSMCAAIPDKDYVDSYTNQQKIPPFSSITGKIYTSFVVNPPTKEMRNLNGLHCTVLNDGISQECVVDTTGNVSPVFYFDPTYGKFYSRTQIPNHPLTGAPACYTSNEAAQNSLILHHK